MALQNSKSVIKDIDTKLFKTFEVPCHIFYEPLLTGEGIFSQTDTACAEGTQG